MPALAKIMVACFAAMMIVSASAQGVSRQKQPARPASAESLEARARGLFVSKKADALRVKVLNSKGEPVDPVQEFRPGDEITIDLESNFDGYVYVINIEEGGKMSLLFPNVEATNNRIKANQTYRLPPGAVIKFDKKPGIEILQVIMSRAPIKTFDQALSSSSAEIATTAPQEIKMPEQGGIAGDNLARVLPAAGPGATRARNIIVAAGRDKDPQGSVVAISDEGAQGKLKSGEAVAFEIRLKHVGATGN